jgi:segregation and condensation protein B
MVERRQFPRRFDGEGEQPSRNGDPSVPTEEPSAVDEPTVDEATVDEATVDGVTVDEVPSDEAPSDEPMSVDLPESAVTGTAAQGQPPAGAEELPAGLAAAVREAEADPASGERRVGDPPPTPDVEELPRRLEALLFVADHPVDEPTLALSLSVERRQLRAALESLGVALRESGRGVRLQQGPEGVQLVSDPEAAEYIEYFLGLEASRKLSNAALETLAIVAYRQPVTRSGIDAVRGVNSDGAVATLRARGLIQETGRAPTPGRPRLFGTTQRFLEHFGLERASDLPPLPEDVELPPHEIGEQLGLDDTEVAALLAAEAAAEEAPPDAEAEISGEVDALVETAAALADAGDAGGGDAAEEAEDADELQRDGSD